MLKNCLILILFFSCTLSLFAQKKHVGISYSYLCDSQRSGIGIYAGLNIWGQLKVLPDFTYYFKRNKTQIFSSNVNLGYSLKFYSGKLDITPYLGIGILTIDTRGYVFNPGGDPVPGRPNEYFPPRWIDISDNYSELVANLGLDAKISISKHLYILMGSRYIPGVGEYFGVYLNQFIVSTGLGFQF